MVGQKLREMVPDEADGWAELYGGVLRTGVPIRFERELVATGRYLELAAFRIEPASRRQVAVLFQDITARKRAEAAMQHLNETLEARVAEAIAERKHAEEALRQSQKMEAVGQLTGGIAHDFNNLLAGIIGSLEMLQTRLRRAAPPRSTAMSPPRQGASKRAAALTHRLLAFSRRQTLDPKPTDVNRLVTDMEELIRRTVGPEIDGRGRRRPAGCGRRWSIPPSSRTRCSTCASTRATRCRTAAGSRSRPRNKWLDDRAAKERDLPPGQYLSRLRHRHRHRHDARGDRARVRSVLHHQAARPGHRASACRWSMASCGSPADRCGSIPRSGKGTTMCLYLPRHHGDWRRDATMRRPPRPQHACATGETVLVVDDEPTVRMLVAEVLEELGYAAIEAPDGPSGLRMLQSDARIDLLITDVGLPGGMNGRQLADAARATRPDLKVLFITGYAENAVVGNGQLGRRHARC